MFKLLIPGLKQWLCKHTFRGVDMVARDALGIVSWPCHKCGKVYEAEYGLAISNYGTITGPWLPEAPAATQQDSAIRRGGKHE